MTTEKLMTRRTALTAIGATATAALAAPAIAQEAPTLHWRLISSQPRSLAAAHKAATTLIERVSEATDGKFQLQFFAPGEIVGGQQALDAVQDGTVECCHTPPFFYIGKSPTFAFGSTLPFGLNTRQHNAWLHEGGGLKLLNAFYDGYNVHNIPFGNTTAQMGGWYRKEIKTPEDFRGLRIRVSGIAGQVLQKLGAVPQATAVADIYPSMERGTIDAAELSGPLDDEAAGLHRVAPYYYYPGWQEPCAATSLFINKQSWESLPPSYQAILTAAAAEGEKAMITAYDHGNTQALMRLIGEGTQFHAFPTPVLEALFDTSEALMAEISASDPVFAEIYQSWRAYRGDIARWFGIAETAMDSITQRFLRRA